MHLLVHNQKKCLFTWKKTRHLAMRDTLTPPTLEFTICQEGKSRLSITEPGTAIDAREACPSSLAPPQHWLVHWGHLSMVTVRRWHQPIKDEDTACHRRRWTYWQLCAILEGGSVRVMTIRCKMSLPRSLYLGFWHIMQVFNATIERYLPSPPWTSRGFSWTLLPSHL